MTTTENNKLIAEFMGIVYPKLNNVIVIDNVIIKVEDLHYHTSWDWLHNVIDKCFKVAQDGDMIDIMHHLQVSDRDATYNAVVEFINFYNKK